MMFSTKQPVLISSAKMRRMSKRRQKIYLRRRFHRAVLGFVGQRTDRPGLKDDLMRALVGSVTPLL